MTCTFFDFDIGSGLDSQSPEAAQIRPREALSRAGGFSTLKEKKNMESFQEKPGHLVI